MDFGEFGCFFFNFIKAEGVIGANLSDDEDSIGRILVDECALVTSDSKLLPRFKFGIVSCNEGAIEVATTSFIKGDVNSNSNNESIAIELLVNLSGEPVMIFDKFVIALFCPFALLLLLLLLLLFPLTLLEFVKEDFLLDCDTEFLLFGETFLGFVAKGENLFS